MKRFMAVLILCCMLAPLAAGCAQGQDTAALPTPETATIAVLVGTTSEAFVEANYPNAVKLPFDSLSDAVSALLAGKADYVLSAYTNCLNFARANVGKLTVLPQVLTNDGASIAISKDEKELGQSVSDAVERFLSDGTMERLIANWIRDDGSAYVQDEIPILSDAPVLNVAVSAEREPMCFVQNGKIVGLDAELIQRIAYELGMRVAFHDMKFSAMIPSVLSGKTPVAISNLSATEERRQSVDFSPTYFQNPQVLMTQQRQETAPEGYTTLDSLGGKRIGIGNGSVFDHYALAQWPDAQLLYYETDADMIIALKQNKIDAYLADEPVGRVMAMTTPGLRMLSEALSPDQYGFVFQKNDTGAALRDDFNAFISTAEDGKLLKNLEDTWFGTDDTKKTVEPADALPATNGVIHYAAIMEAEPFNYLRNEQPVGIEIALITRFCKERGYGLEISTASFSALLPGIVSGRYDAASSCISITAERAQSVNFSDPIYNGGVVAMVLDASGAVAAEDARIGAMTGTTCEALAREKYPNAFHYSYTATSDMMAALQSGKLDYCVLSRIDAINYKRSDPAYTVASGVLKQSACSIAVAKGNEALVEKLNARLDQYEADGTLVRLAQNWVRPDGSAYVMDKVNERADGPELRVAVSSGMEPNCFVKDGQLSGMDVELMRRLAYDLGYRVTFSDMAFSALVAALEAGRADVAISGMAATEERAQKVDFTRSYYDDPLVLVSYEGVAVVQKSFWDSLSDSFYKNFVLENRWELILSGVGVTLLLSVCSGVVGMLFGFAFCLMRMSRSKALGGVASALTRVLQGTPIVVLLMILYYVVFNKTGLDGISVATIAFGLNFGAYASEIMLSGINAVDGGQREAAAAIGFTPVQTFLKIVFPQAARHFLPVLKGEYISLVKMTSIVGYVAVQDLTKMSDIIRSRTYEAFFPLIVTAIIYFLLSFGLSSLLKLVEIRVDPKHRARTLKGVELQ